MKCIDNGVNNVGRIGVGDRVEEFGTFIKCRHDRLQAVDRSRCHENCKRQKGGKIYRVLFREV